MSDMLLLLASMAQDRWLKPQIGRFQYVVRAIGQSMHCFGTVIHPLYVLTAATCSEASSVLVPTETGVARSVQVSCSFRHSVTFRSFILSLLK